MKNTHIKNLKEVIPSNIRLQTYKDALDYYGQIYTESRDYTEGLCLVLPCIMWGLPHYLSNAPDGDYWGPNKSQEVFPELGRDIHRIRSPYLTDVTRMNLRMELLRNWIKELSDD